MITAGEPWGTEVDRPAGLTLADTDAAAVRVFERDPDAVVGLAGGDLYRSLGAPRRRDPVLALPIDAIRVELDERDRHTAIAHVIVRRSWWRGRVVAVMNVDHLGGWNVAPRAHPNDGLADVVEARASMSVRDRWSARRRLTTGTHVPHPDVSVARVRAQSWKLDRAHAVWIDGVRVAEAEQIAVTVEPDAFTVFV